ncbi:Pre-mRNA-splicing factor SYF1-like protein [Drosera capensis]
MSLLNRELYPSESDLPYEEELIRNPFSLRHWWRYLIHRSSSLFKSRPPLPPRQLQALARLPQRTPLGFVSQKGVPIQTSLRVYRRYLKYDPGHIEEFIEFLVESGLWQEAAERLAGHRLWLELCDLLTTHANEVEGLNVNAIIRGGIRKFTDEVGRLWTSLADYYIRRKLPEKARDVLEEGMTTVVTVRDFGVIFDAYSLFEESMLAYKMENMDLSEEEEEEDGEGSVEDEFDIGKDVDMPVAKFETMVLCGFWLHDDNDVDLRLARLENLMDRRSELANSVLLRQNPYNVEQWHRRVKLFEGNPTRQIVTFTEAVRTVDPMRAVNYKTVDHLASVWCEWAEMELRHQMFGRAIALMQRATAVPTVGVKRIVPADSKDPNEPVQMKLHRSLRLWTFYVDLEESLGTLESTREHKYFEDAFQVYERGVKIFKYPHVNDIWVTYLSKFVKRYGKTKLERARELFERAVESAPAESVKPLYLQYAKLEEDYGLTKRAMTVYQKAVKAVLIIRS